MIGIFLTIVILKCHGIICHKFQIGLRTGLATCDTIGGNGWALASPRNLLRKWRKTNSNSTLACSPVVFPVAAHNQKWTSNMSG